MVGDEITFNAHEYDAWNTKSYSQQLGHRIAG